MVISTPVKAKVALQDIQNLPESARLLTAYCLDSNLREFSLLSRETDADELKHRGWIKEQPSVAPGVKNFCFSPSLWRQLQSMRQEILTPHIARSVELYRRKKTQYYPWYW